MAWILLSVVFLAPWAHAQRAAMADDNSRGALLGSLPDSPGFGVGKTAGQNPATQILIGQTSTGQNVAPGAPVRPDPQAGTTNPEAASAQQASRSGQTNPLALFVNTPVATPLTVKQKGYLAIHDVIDPFNLLTIGANAAFTVGFDSHSAYGPGMKGFGRDVGYSFVQDATGEFIGTFGVCSLLHEDPRYHRMPNGTTRQRLLHALARTVLAQHDDGTRMLNYENFITYPASAEISNLYVPGVHGDGPSTVERFLTGLATDPVNNIITEFLPDFAKRVHIRVVFVQQILNQIASGQSI